MTTTLRPASHAATAGTSTAGTSHTAVSRPGPAADGWYAICSNGRPIGRVHLTRTGRWGPGVGWIDHVEVLVSRRRRGHASVALLAAEELLRASGCTRIAADVPEDNPSGARLVGSLGYTPDGLYLTMRVPGGLDAPTADPGLPPGVVLRPATAAEHERWRAAALARHVEQLTAAGWTPRDARVRALDRLGTGSPDGAHVLDAGGEVVGTLWVSLDTAVPGRAEVLAVEVAPELRGRGYGDALLRAAPYLAYAAGLGELGIELIGRTPKALAPCEALGFTVRSRLFGKAIY